MSANTDGRAKVDNDGDMVNFLARYEIDPAEDEPPVPLSRMC